MKKLLLSALAFTLCSLNAFAGTFVYNSQPYTEHNDAANQIVLTADALKAAGYEVTDTALVSGERGYSFKINYSGKTEVKTNTYKSALEWTAKKDALNGRNVMRMIMEERGDFKLLESGMRMNAAGNWEFFITYAGKKQADSRTYYSPNVYPTYQEAENRMIAAIEVDERDGAVITEFSVLPKGDGYSFAIGFPAK